MVEWAKTPDRDRCRAVYATGQNYDFVVWPLPNVHLGVSVEDQQRADERVPALVELSRMGWKTIISQEPQVEPVEYRDAWAEAIGGIICGGESGSHARPFDVAWARQTKDWCEKHGVKFFLKQLGANVNDVTGEGKLWPSMPQFEQSGIPVRYVLRSPKGSDPAEWPEDLRACQNLTRLPWAMTTATEGSEA